MLKEVLHFFYNHLSPQKKSRVWYKYDYTSNTPEFFEEIPSSELSLGIQKVIIFIPHLGIDSKFYAGLRMIIALAYELIGKGLNIHFVITELNSKQSSTSSALNHILLYFPDLDEKKVSFSFRDEPAPIGLEDIAITTSWRTWYGTKEILKRVKKIYYFIQDFEPGFYPWSTEFAMSLNTYKQSFTPIFSSVFLKTYFLEQGFSFAKEALVYDLHINSRIFFPPSIESLSAPGRKRKLILYGRENTPRNLFGLAVQTLAILTKDHPDLFQGWSFVSIGEKHRQIQLHNSMHIISAGKLSLDEYGALLRDSDVGLSLMLSPHPSYPPLEMLACGMIVVTNSFANKDLEASYPNTFSAMAESQDLANQIIKAVNLSSNIEKRTSSYKDIDIPSSQSDSFKATVAAIKKDMYVK